MAAATAELILASASEGRAAALRAAGLPFRQEAAPIDERALEADITGGPDADAVALTLAEAKANAVSAKYPNALVIGADQVMECGGVLYQKAPSVAAARAQLLELRGKTHSLRSAVCVATAGRTAWRHVDAARLTMREFSGAFLDEYCRAEGEAMLQTVGAYRIEGRGIQLLSAVEGSHFTIIGLPLLPLLSYLRAAGWPPVSV